MKPIKTLDELKKELMSEHGAVYKAIRFRLETFNLQCFSVKRNGWVSENQWSHFIIFDLENWCYYEKPKKIVKEEIEGFVDSTLVENYKYTGVLVMHTATDRVFKTKAKLIVEREVEE